MKELRCIIRLLLLLENKSMHFEAFPGSFAPVWMFSRPKAEPTAQAENARLPQQPHEAAAVLGNQKVQ